MKAILLAAGVVALSAGLSSAVFADESSPSMPNGALGMTFHYTTSVKTPKGTKSGSGQITIASAGENKLALTLTTSDGTSKTIPLSIANGSVTPAVSPAASMPPEAQAMLANMKLAATVGVAAKKSGGSSFSVPVTLAPIGTGTPVPANLAMTAKPSGANVTYSGTVGGPTYTTLPQSNGGIDPAQLVKHVGVGVATHGFTPAGRIATAVAMHHREQEQKQAAKGAVPDTISITITATFENGRFHDISGAQTDAVSLAGKTTKIYSSWSFTAAPH